MSCGLFDARLNRGRGYNAHSGPPAPASVCAAAPVKPLWRPRRRRPSARVARHAPPPSAPRGAVRPVSPPSALEQHVPARALPPTQGSFYDDGGFGGGGGFGGLCGLRLLSADEVLAAAADLGSGAWLHRGRCVPLPPVSPPPPLVPRRLRFPSPAELAVLAEPPLEVLAGWTQQHEQLAQRGQQPDVRSGGGLRASDASAAAAAAYAEALSRDLAEQPWQLDARTAGLHVPTLVAQLAEGLLQELLAAELAAAVADATAGL